VRAKDLEPREFAHDGLVATPWAPKTAPASADITAPLG
jgi:hypothetical protein